MSRFWSWHVGYWVLPEQRGHGYARRVLRLMSSWALDTGLVAELVCRVDRENLPSLRVATGSGYTFLRVDRGAYEHGGRRRDLDVFVKRSTTFQGGHGDPG